MYRLLGWPTDKHEWAGVGMIETDDSAMQVHRMPLALMTSGPVVI